MPYLRCICAPPRKRLCWFPSWFETNRLATKWRPLRSEEGRRLRSSFRGSRSENPESRDSGSGPTDHPGMTGPVYSLLALRTPERRAAVLGKPLDDAAAAVSLAFLALAVINLKRMLEIAELAG